MIRRSRSGFTLIEMVVSCGLLAFASVWFARWANQPSSVQKAVLAADQERQVTAATNLIAQDLSEADPSSFPWSAIPPQNTSNLSSISFQKVHVTISNGATMNYATYGYAIQPGPNGQALVRTNPDGSTTVVLAPVDAPTANAPFFQADPVMPNIVIMTVQYHPHGSAPISIVRRIAVAS